MKYNLLKGLIDLLEDFEEANLILNYSPDKEGFKKWIFDSFQQERRQIQVEEPDWEGKEKGRTAESVISTLFVHLSKYAKIYSKAAIHGSEIATQEDFIYLIHLNSFGSMSKMELIKKNIQEKSSGMLVINRLIQNEWVEQKSSTTDRRSTLIEITPLGVEVLQNQMQQIKKATQIVSGDLNYRQKMELIRLLNQLDQFHKPIFEQNLNSPELLDYVENNYFQEKIENEE